MDFAIHLPMQLREHLRALRKERGLTQAALGRLLGVGQARVAEIENNPGVVSVEQLMRVLSALQVALVLRDEAMNAEPSPPAKAAIGKKALSPSPLQPVKAPASKRLPTGPGQVLHDVQPKAYVAPAPRRNFVSGPKKGSW